MGIVLYPQDGDTSSPDVTWSYTGFHAFRMRLAQTEGFALSEMSGFAGELPWSSVSTTLIPLLHHPDDGGPPLTPAQCAAMLPRLVEIISQWQGEDSDPLLQQHIADARQLVVVLRFCVDKDVELGFH
jgi:hypothetical protein